MDTDVEAGLPAPLPQRPGDHQRGHLRPPAQRARYNSRTSNVVSAGADLPLRRAGRPGEARAERRQGHLPQVIHATAVGNRDGRFTGPDAGIHARRVTASGFAFRPETGVYLAAGTHRKLSTDCRLSRTCSWNPTPTVQMRIRVYLGRRARARPRPRRTPRPHPPDGFHRAGGAGHGDVVHEGVETHPEPQRVFQDARRRGAPRRPGRRRGAAHAVGREQALDFLYQRMESASRAAAQTVEAEMAGLFRKDEG